MKSLELPAELFTCTPEGTWRLAGTRVSAASVIHGFWAGATPEQMCQDFPSLSLGQVYAVVAYYLSHRLELDRYLKQEHRVAERLRRRLKRQHRGFLADLRRRMLARRRTQAHAA
ncbi:MAG: DUF433 domain-containing protein [Deltaproteobacteria bacterium]|nr:DUF433 domain-containing protein [Deltaproteobacteria bacterium]